MFSTIFFALSHLDSNHLHFDTQRPTHKVVLGLAFTQKSGPVSRFILKTPPPPRGSPFIDQLSLNLSRTPFWKPFYRSALGCKTQWLFSVMYRRNAGESNEIYAARGTELLSASSNSWLLVTECVVVQKIPQGSCILYLLYSDVRELQR